MDLLEPHITSGLGVSFKADNGNYLSVIGRSNNQRNIEAEKSYKYFWSKFTIHKIDNNHVYIQGADGKYLSRIDRDGVQHIEDHKTHKDRHCVFKVFSADGKVVFQADNGRFWSRIYRNSQQNIEAQKSILDDTTKFIVETGASLPVTEEIVDIKWGVFQSPAEINPTALVSQEVTNGGTRDLVKTFILEKTIERSQETNWEHSWGVTTGISFTSTAGVDVGVASASTSITLSAEVRYDGQRGGNEGIKQTIKFNDQTTVTIPPGKKATTTLMARIIENAEIPFTATIRRSVGGISTGDVIERGTWKGVMVVDSFVRTEEESIHK